MKTPDEVLSGMNRDAEAGFLTDDVIAACQVEATLILAEQTKRIADVLEGVVLTVDDPKWTGTLKVLGVANVREG